MIRYLKNIPFPSLGVEPFGLIYYQNIIFNHRISFGCFLPSDLYSTNM